MSELTEYTRDNYPSFGKKYNNEIGIISLTSWTARINTVAKTLFSLVQQCPNFHIVLVLAEEEFPKICEELPENLMLFVKNKLIELMFVRKNYRSFKKILFTMDKYCDVPVISADDDCIYTCNYAQELYNKWKDNKDCVITYKMFHFDNHYFQHGPAACYPPNVLNYRNSHLEDFVKIGGDDVLIGYLLERKNIKIIEYKKEVPYHFHDSIEPLSGTELRVGEYYKIVKEKLKDVCL